MTPWSIVALAAIICATITFCWGLWLNSVYPNGLPPEEQELDPEEQTGTYPSEETTGTWASPS